MKTRVENYTFPMKTRGKNYTFPTKTGAKNYTFPTKFAEAKIERRKRYRLQSTDTLNLVGAFDCNQHMCSRIIGPDDCNQQPLFTSLKQQIEIKDHF